MTEINLLRWHLPDHQIMQNDLKYWVSAASILIFIFLIAHFILINTIQKFLHEEADLKNKIMLSQLNHSLSFINAEEIDQLQFSQKRVWQAVNLFNCLQESRVQIKKILVEEKQIQMNGFVESSVMLSSALEFCLSEKNSFAVKKIIFNRKDQLKLLQFSFFI